MYDYIEGKLVEKTPTYCVIDAHGLGYLMHISLSTFSAIGNDEACKLFVHQVIREDAHALYGFHTRGERETFRLLINVSGVGASTARMILSSLSAAEIAEAVINNQVGTLKAVKGIGEKTAQRIIIDLKGKLDKEHMSADLFAGVHNSKRHEALTALTLLGFPQNLAEKALLKVLSAGGEEQTVESLIKQTLKII